MILTKKYIAVFTAVIVAVAALVMGIKEYSAREAFSKSEMKVILDAGHGAYA